MIEFHRHFERFAASLVRCLSEASFARKASESATGQNAVNEIRFSDPYLYLYFDLYSIHYIFKLKFTKSLIPLFHQFFRTHLIILLNKPKYHLFHLLRNLQNIINTNRFRFFNHLFDDS